MHLSFGPAARAAYSDKIPRTSILEKTKVSRSAVSEITLKSPEYKRLFGSCVRCWLFTVLEMEREAAAMKFEFGREAAQPERRKVA
jgi:hypothetical protein